MKGSNNKVEKRNKIVRNFFVEKSLCTNKPVLAGSKCKACGRIFFPKQSICSNCFKHEMKKISLSRKGKLYTYTIIHFAPPGFKTPYAVGYIDLPEGVRVFSQLTGCQPFEETLKIGMQMEVVLGKIREDEPHEKISYKFRPVREGESK